MWSRVGVAFLLAISCVGDEAAEAKRRVLIFSNPYAPGAGQAFWGGLAPRQQGGYGPGFQGSPPDYPDEGTDAPNGVWPYQYFSPVYAANPRMPYWAVNPF
eukprot:Polyplicarium_translucidae@DN738_c0_g1_i1.p2